MPKDDNSKVPKTVQIHIKKQLENFVPDKIPEKLKVEIIARAADQVINGLSPELDKIKEDIINLNLHYQNLESKLEMIEAFGIKTNSLAKYHEHQPQPIPHNASQP